MGNVSNFDPLVADDEFTSDAQAAALAAQAAQAAAEAALASLLAALAAQILDDHADVTVPAPATNDIVQWNGAAWVNIPHVLDGVSNVIAAGAADDDVIYFDTTGSTWRVGTPAVAKLLGLPGGTMTGKITLDGDPTLGLHAATKQYVDAVASGTYDISMFANGIPTASLDLMRFVAVRNIFIKIGTAGDSVAIARVAATGITVFDVQKNGVSIGSITFAALATTGVFAITLATNFVSGDSLAIIAPLVPDATLQDIQITVEGILGTTP